MKKKKTITTSSGSTALGGFIWDSWNNADIRMTTDTNLKLPLVKETVELTLTRNGVVIVVTVTTQNGVVSHISVVPR